ncbi:MFS transporter [Streptomyces pini]|uniref:Major Facilitator Superfamily protein n=1 Tax=Streptomyces pini TaxID=1520580 RepID=A0A1I3YI72_9ACTN|nr:MFS transporter [Streptomyces pini]SFK31524.1 Major Facilitator Superfamily protein [Streptomyces pini]
MRPHTGLRPYLVTALLARLAGEGMAVAVVMLAMHRTGSAAQGAFVLTAWMAPHVLAAPLTGALAERARDPRLFYLCALGGMAAGIAVLAAITGRAPLPVVLAVAALGGGCGPVATGGLSGLLARLVPEETGRDRAYALDAATYNAVSVAGPALVSVIAALASPAPAVLLLAISAASAAVTAAALPYGRADAGEGESGDGTAAPGPESRRTLPADLGAGLAAMWHVRELRAVTAATSLAFVGVGGLTTTAVLLAGVRGRPDAGGVLMTALALGALTGSLAVARWLRSFPTRRLVPLCLTGAGLGLAAAAAAPSFAVQVALFAVAGVFEGPLLSATLRIRADHSPPGVRAQVFTIGAGLKISAAACGSALAGAAAGLPPQLLLLGIAALQFAAAGLHRLLRPRPRPAGKPAARAGAPARGQRTSG